MDNSKLSIKHSKLRSFTLIELLVVIGVMGLLMSMAMPQFTKMIKGNKVNNVVSKVGSELSYCRTHAISKRCKTRFTLTATGSATSAGAYTTEYQKSDDSWVCMNNGTGTPLVKKLESTVTISGLDADDTVTFRSTGATVESIGTITVTGSESTGVKTLEVNQFTGKVSYP